MMRHCPNFTANAGPASGGAFKVFHPRSPESSIAAVRKTQQASAVEC
jgi:hypothetical protein